MARIDAHLHFAAEHPEAMALVEEFDLKLHNICNGTQPGWRDLLKRYRILAERQPKRFAWCTSFDPPGFGEADYVERVIEGLRQDFAAGASAVKVHKGIGLSVKTPGGGYFMVDDPLWAPIFRWLEDHRLPVVMHVADPWCFWQDPATLTNPPDGAGSLRGVQGLPSYEQLIAARDRILERYPRLPLIGAHMGSQSHDLPAVAERLQRFPNYAVDTSARLVYLARQDSSKVREFVLRHRDRVLWGTDITKIVGHDMPDTQRQPLLNRLREIYRHAFLYYETKGEVPIHERTWRAEGLNLPANVLEAFYAGNAKRYLLGI